MNNKAAKTFLFIALGLLAAVTAAAPFFAEPLGEAYVRAAGTYGIPLVAIYSIPALIALIALGITSAAYGRWLYKGDRVLLATNLAVAVCILLLAGVRLMAALSFDMDELVDSVIPAILIAVAALLLGFCLGMFISGVQAIVKERKNIPAEERKPVSYPQLFVLVWALLCSFFLTLGFIVIDTGSPASGGGFGANMFSFLGLFMVFAAGLSGLVYLIFLLWKRSKWISVFIGLLASVVCLVAFVTYIALNSFHRYYLGVNDNNYRYEYDDEWPETEAVGVYDYDEDYDDYDDYEEDFSRWEESYGAVDNIDDLWAYPATDSSDSVSAAIEYGAEHIDASHPADNPPLRMMPWTEGFDDSYWDETRPDGPGREEYWRLANFVFRRSCSINLQDLWSEYKNVIMTALPYKLYRENGYEQTVNRLIMSYDDMKGNSKTFAALYDLMADDGMDYDDKRDSILEYVSAAAKVHFMYEYDGGEYLDTTLVIWAYSFWARRHHECDGNPKDIYKTLTAVRKAYSKAAVDTNVAEVTEVVEEVAN